MSIFLRSIFIIIQSTVTSKRERALWVEFCVPKKMLEFQLPGTQNVNLSGDRVCCFFFLTSLLEYNCFTMVC